MIKVLSIQDFSTYTKSSGNIALPLFEAAAVDFSLLPTSILSTQTDGWTRVFKKNLTKEAFEIVKIWHSEGVRFDFVQIGYLASFEDLALIDFVIENLLKKEGLVIFDPVLGDNGALYTKDREDLLEPLKNFLKNRTWNTIITPNYTEACFLAGVEYNTCEDKAAFCKQLVKMYGANIIITSFPDNSNVYCSDNDFETVFYCPRKQSYPGTGDLFTALFSICIAKNKTVSFALKFATETATECVKYSEMQKREYREGVLISPAIDNLYKEVRM